MQSLEARPTPLDSMPWNRRAAEILVPASASTAPDDMETWILTRIAETLEVDPLGIDPALSPAVYGFDVVRARTLTRELEQCLGRELPENVFAGGRNVRGVAESLCTRAAQRSPRPLNLMTREEMRSQVLARAARRPRRPSTDTGDGLGWDPAGCSPSEPTLAGPLDLDLDLALAS